MPRVIIMYLLEFQVGNRLNMSPAIEASLAPGIPGMKASRSSIMAHIRHVHTSSKESLAKAAFGTFVICHLRFFCHGLFFLYRLRSR